MIILFTTQKGGPPKVLFNGPPETVVHLDMSTNDVCVDLTSEADSQTLSSVIMMLCKQLRKEIDHGS